jgi:hypothetical protein
MRDDGGGTDADDRSGRGNGGDAKGLSINNLHNSHFGEVNLVEVMQSCGCGAKRDCAVRIMLRSDVE